MLLADNLKLQQQPLKAENNLPDVGSTTTTTTSGRGNSNSITRLAEKNYWDRNKNREISRQSLGNRRLKAAAADGENGERLLQSSECCLMLSGIGGS